MSLLYAVFPGYVHQSTFVDNPLILGSHVAPHLADAVDKEQSLTTESALGSAASEARRAVQSVNALIVLLQQDEPDTQLLARQVASRKQAITDVRGMLEHQCRFVLTLGILGFESRRSRYR